MRRLLLVVAVMAVMAAMVVAMSVPAFALGPEGNKHTRITACNNNANPTNNNANPAHGSSDCP